MAPEKEDNADILYINIESYMFKMIPKNCYLNRTYAAPFFQFQLYKNGEFLLQKRGSITDSEIYVSVYGFKKDDNFTMHMQMDWNY